jgi:multidrug efflux pump
VQAGHAHAKTGFFGAFNRGFARSTKTYEGWVAKLLRRSGRMMVVYVALVAAVGVLYLRLPTSFLPNEDQGTVLVNIQLPPGATQERTRAVAEKVEAFMLAQPEVKSMVAVLGFSFSGQGQNAALSFVTLKDWAERPGEAHTAEAVAKRAMGALMGIRDAFYLPAQSAADSRVGQQFGLYLSLTRPGWQRP